MKKGRKRVLAGIGVVCIAIAAWKLTPSEQTLQDSTPTQTLIEVEPEPIALRFGLPVDSFNIVQQTIKSGQTFGNILSGFGVAYPIVDKIARDFKDIFDVRDIRSGKNYSVFLASADSSEVARYLVYEESPVSYYVFDLSDSTNVYKGEKEVSVKQREIAGTINSSLYEALMEQGGSIALAMKMADIYAWSVDFFRIQKGDNFKVIYEERFIDDTVSVGVGRIIAADFNYGGRDFYSFYFEKGEEYSDYFDEEGGTLRRAFLKAPLDFFRISSRYNPRRFHPVLKRTKAHLGTDYAAPHGTPIRSTADGTVIKAGYTGGNGNYVKVKHNSTYTTQYLHMSKFAKGIKTGRVVKQGEVIGYVGSTGLATGPHVCYRFWKNGKQVDPYAQDLPAADPIKADYKEEYFEYIGSLKSKLDSMTLPNTKSHEDEVLMASAD